MTKAELNILITAKDEASRVINGIGGNIKGAMGQIAKIGGFALAGLGAGITTVGGLALKTASDFETMRTALETSFQGSKEEADAAFQSIKEFTADTPFGMAEVMRSFIKLKNMGLDPSQRALTAYGDTASAMGKSLNDMVEAVADAATGEFERLKEFGIRASSEGDRVKFTFKGVTTEVGKNSEEIQEYLLQLGETNFAGGMANQSTTLAGLMSTLQGTFADVLNTIAVETRLLDIAKKGVIAFGDAIVNNKDQIVALAQGIGQLARLAMPLLENGMQSIKTLFISFQTNILPGLIILWGHLKESLDKAWATVQEQVVPSLMDLWASIQELWIAVQPLVEIIGVALFAALLLIIETLPHIINVIIIAINWTVQFTTAIINLITNGINWLIDKFNEWKENNTELIAFLTTAWNSFVANIQAAMELVATIFTTVTNIISTLWNATVDNIRLGVQFVREILSGDFSGAWETAKQMVANAVAAMEAVIGDIKNAVTSAVSYVNVVWTGIQNTLERPFTAARDAIKGVVQDIKDAVSDAKNAITDLPSSAGDFAGGIGKNIEKAAGRLFAADGGIVPGNSFTGDRLSARVNSGEMILNRSQQQNLFDMIKSGQGGGGNVTYNITINSNTDNPRGMVDQIVSELAIRQQNANLGAFGNF